MLRYKRRLATVRQRARLLGAAWLCIGFATAACVTDVIVGDEFGAPNAASAGTNTNTGAQAGDSSGGASGNAGSLAGGDGGISGGGENAGGNAGNSECVVQSCNAKITQCGDCLDNDGDNLIDTNDPECFGACDEREDSFVAGKAEDNCELDCFFDNDNGVGNDGCIWSHACDPLSVAPDYPPRGLDACAFSADPRCSSLQQAQSDQCKQRCGPITPNGCDCFGCCELPAGSGQFIWLGSEPQAGVEACSSKTLSDPRACHPCTPVIACLNTCEPCELCIGRPALASNCPVNVQQCPSGFPACGRLNQAPCPTGSYCLTGCCVSVK